MNKILMMMAGASLVVASGIAAAGPVYDTITVYDGSHNVIASVTGTQAEAEAGDTVVVPDVAVDLSQFGNYSLVVDNGKVLDIYGICNACSGSDTYNLGFQALPQGYPLQNVSNDTGLPLSMTQYLAPDLRDSGDTAWFTATGSIVQGVPEPGTLGLLALGVGALLWMRRRRALVS